MVPDRKRIPFEEFVQHASDIFDEIVTHGETIEVERDGNVITLRPKAKRGKRKSRHFSLNDPLWDIVGIGRSGGPGDVSENKYKYVAEAIAQTKSALARAQSSEGMSRADQEDSHE
ncbi:MAG TPA: hypothetical protein VKQ36_02900 [Ktedonobacterales bacterium]|nr:hypothetical protein [Ktedonobacterales bacterium]